jgi:hypothetical protein
MTLTSDDDSCENVTNSSVVADETLSLTELVVTVFASPCDVSAENDDITCNKVSATGETKEETSSEIDDVVPSTTTPVFMPVVVVGDVMMSVTDDVSTISLDELSASHISPTEEKEDNVPIPAAVADDESERAPRLDTASLLGPPSGASEDSRVIVEASGDVVEESTTPALLPAAAAIDNLTIY